MRRRHVPVAERRGSIFVLTEPDDFGHFLLEIIPIERLLRRAVNRDRARRMSNLGAAYQARFERRGVAADLDKAIEVGRQAVAARVRSKSIAFEHAHRARDLPQRALLAVSALLPDRLAVPYPCDDLIWMLLRLGDARREVAECAPAFAVEPAAALCK